MAIFATIFVIFCALFCIIMLYMQRGTHPELFELLDGEEIIKMAKGDFWCDVDSDDPGDVQNMGEFAFTNKRFLYSMQKNFLIPNPKKIYISYDEIETIEKANVSAILPVAFIISLKDGRKYKFAIMKRQPYIDLINSHINK